MVIQETATDTRVVLLDWLTLKLRSTLFFQSQNLKKVTFNPADKDVVVTTGVNHFRVWRITEGQFKPMVQIKINQQHIYTEQIWLEKDQLLAFSQDGEMYLFDNFELKQEAESAF